MAKRENPPKEAKDAEADKKAADHNLELLRDLNYQASQPSQRVADLQNFRLPAHYDPPSRKGKRKMTAAEEEILEDVAELGRQIAVPRPRAATRKAKAKNLKGKGKQKATDSDMEDSEEEIKAGAEENDIEDEGEAKDTVMKDANNDEVFELETQIAMAKSRKLASSAARNASGAGSSSAADPFSAGFQQGFQKGDASGFARGFAAGAASAASGASTAGGSSAGPSAATSSNAAAAPGPRDGDVRDGWTFSTEHRVWFPPTASPGPAMWICNKCNKKAKPQHLFFVDAQGNRLQTRINCAKCLRRAAKGGDLGWMPAYPWDA